jgi:uncharacterized protein (DUF58 family)
LNRTLLLALSFTLVILGMLTLRGEVVALALPVLVALGFGAAVPPPKIWLAISRRVVPDRAVQGQPIEVQLRIVNEGPAIQDVMLQDTLPYGLTLADGATELLVALEPGGAAELSYTIKGRRGLYRFGAVRATVQDQLGMYRRVSEFSAPGRLFILPELIQLRDLLIRPRRTRIYAGQIPARQGGTGIEFFGVRDYQPGDQLRYVNARATARHTDALFVNEFEQERVADIGIVLDARARSDVPGKHETIFEHAVQAAAALADSFLSQGNRVGLLIYGNAIQWTFPGYGKLQREKVLQALSAAGTGDRLALESLDLIPARLFPMRSLLVIISPLVSDDVRALASLRARGYQMAVISPDPVAFERATLGESEDATFGARLASVERELMMRRLRQVGVPTVNWPVETPLALAAAQVLARQRMP